MSGGTRSRLHKRWAAARVPLAAAIVGAVSTVASIDPACAEVSGEDFAPPAVSLSSEEQARLAAEVEAESRRAASARAAREAQQATERAAAEAEQRRWLAAMPRGEQLLRQRCVQCHRVESAVRGQHGVLGWSAVAARMRLWHGAELPLNEVLPLARHLAAAAPAPAARVALEWALAIGSVLAALRGGAWIIMRRRRRRR